MLTKIEDVALYRDDRYYCGPGPAVVCFPDGELRVVFRRHRCWAPEVMMHVHPTTEQCMIRSADDGRTWSPPRVFMGGGQCAVAGLKRDGTMLFVTHRQELVPYAARDLLVDGVSAEVATLIAGLRADGQGENADSLQRKQSHWPTLSAGTEIWRSDNRGADWEGPSWVGEIPGLPPLHPGLHAPVHLRGFPIELADGDLVLPVQGRGVGSILVASADGGLSWEFRGLAAPNPPGRAGMAFNEWSVIETAAGDLVGFVRSEMEERHGGGYLWTVRSSDKGRTWSPPRREDVWGYPYFALTLPSGNVLIVYGYRREPYGIRARVLDPECRAPGDAQEHVIRRDGGVLDLGYPHAAPMRDGRVFIVYYFNGADGGQRFVAGTIVKAA